MSDSCRPVLICGLLSPFFKTTTSRLFPPLHLAFSSVEESHSALWVFGGGHLITYRDHLGKPGQSSRLKIINLISPAKPLPYKVAPTSLED